jgi:hypothetical protein
MSASNIAHLGGDSYCSEDDVARALAPQKIETTDIPCSGVLEVRYPSGRQFRVVGKFVLAKISDDDPWVHAVILDPDQPEHAILLDQRAIVTLNGINVYHPRRNIDGLTPEMRSWLEDNLAW